MLVHDRPGGHRRGGRRGWPGRRGEGGYDHLGRRRAVAERGVRAHLVVVASPALDHDLGLAQAVEDLAVEQLVPQAGAEALHVPVLPRAARGDVGGPRTHGRDPSLDGLGDELRAVVGAEFVAGRAVQEEEVGQGVDHVDRLELAGDPGRQALVGELVEDVGHAVLPPVVGAVLDEVVGPDVVRALGPQPDAGAVRQPEPATLGLLFGGLQPLAAPDPLHPLVVDDPARRRAQQLRDLPVAVAAVPAREFDDVGRELFLVVPAPRGLALRRAVLAEHAAPPPLGHPYGDTDVLDAGAAPRGAQRFPAAASLRISLSSVRSATARRRRAFSVSSSFRRLTWSVLSPPYSWRQRW